MLGARIGHGGGVILAWATVLLLLPTAGHMHIGAGAARAPALPAEPQRVENGRGHVAAMDHPVELIH